VRFAQYQEASKASSHRQRAKNFSNEAGFVYHVAGDDVVEPDETCFLATDSLFRLGRMIIGARSAPGSSCVQADSARIAVAKSRPLISCTLLLTSDSLPHVVAVQFENRGDSALASIALVDASKVAFLDYPALAPPGESTWRADDGGRFSPEHFRVLFVIGAPALQVLAFTWGAPEGELLTLAARTGSSDSLVEVMKSYRYW
jgi:hypothetical protein